MPIPHRKSNRLKNYDYSQPRWYFVTICTQDKVSWFGDIKKRKIKLTQFGMIANQCWLDIPKHFPNVKLDEFVIMPNHVHGIVIINQNDDNSYIVGNNDRCSLRKTNRNMELLPKIISQYKSSVSRIIRKLTNQIQPIWQKSFYDHIIRNESSCAKIREYIKNNPLRWDLDKNADDKLEL